MIIKNKNEATKLPAPAAEFMEHDDKRLPLDTRTLGALAEKCHAFAKALHYKVSSRRRDAHRPTLRVWRLLQPWTQQEQCG